MVGMVLLAVFAGLARAVSLEPQPLASLESVTSRLCPQSLSFCPRYLSVSDASPERSAQRHAGWAYLNEYAVAQSFPLQVATAALRMPVTPSGQSGKPIKPVALALNEGTGHKPATGGTMPRSVLVAMLALIGVVALARRRVSPKD